MNNDKISKDPSFAVMTLDILNKMLSRADNPGRLIEYLAEEIREITGARCVLFLKCMGDFHQVIGINPLRRSKWAESAEAHRLFELIHELSDPQIWLRDVRSEASGLLSKAGFDLSITLPLIAGNDRIGAMLVLGLPEEKYVETEIRLLKTLSTVAALVLRNSFLFTYQEKIIEERTIKLTISEFTLENMKDAVYWINPDASIWKFNSSACQLLGYSRDELSKLAVTDIAPLLTMEGMAAQWKEMKKNGFMDFETVLQAKDGQNIPVDISLNYFEYDNKEYVCATARNISARKQLENESKKLQAQFQQAQKMESVGRLAGGIAHDFNNMLQVILAHSELAMARIDPEQTLHTDLQEIRKAAEHSANLVRQLLAFARKQTIDPKVLDLNETVEGMLKMLRRLIGEDIHLAWLPETSLWAIKMDPSQIDQILVNLCVNARDAIEGIGKVTIETQNAVLDEAYCAEHAGFIPGKYVLLAISDNGTGMNKEILDRLFEPFFTTKEMGKGTGLGLAMIYGIVKQNNGFINVYSEPFKGTTFKIYLPRQENKARQEQKIDTLKSVDGGTETILLVEDEPMILDIGKIMLERLGYKVLPAATPSEAFSIAETHTGRIHLLMTDVVMPEMNGRDLARSLFSLYPDLKVLFMSGYTANVIAHHGILDADISFIQKPFSMQDLAARVRETLLL